MIIRIFRGAPFAAAMALVCALAGPAFSAGGYKPAASHEGPAQAASGWYLGGLVGYGLADTTLSEEDDSFDYDVEGAAAGGLLGWNLHHGRFVLGFEGDLLGANMDARVDGGDATVESDVNWMLGLRARAGYHVTPKILLFATLGAGWADMDLDVLGPGGASASQTFFGVQYGGGAEVALGRAWSLRLDYIHTDLGAERVFYPGGAVFYDPDIDQVRGGLLRRF